MLAATATTTEAVMMMIVTMMMMMMMIMATLATRLTLYDYEVERTSYMTDYYDETEEALLRGPRFDSPLANVSVIEGQTALLPCYIENLADYKVAWLKSDSLTLSFENKTLTEDLRISVKKTSKRNWDLQIREVRVTDTGSYMCSVNVSPVITKVVNLLVRVAAKITDSSPAVVHVKEGNLATLRCKASGHPKPVVTWRRLHSETLCPHNDSNGFLHMHNVSRSCSDTYECAADNGVKAPVYRKFQLVVEYPPKIHLPTRRLKQSVDMEVIMDCNIESKPHKINYWRRYDGQIFRPQSFPAIVGTIFPSNKKTLASSKRHKFPRAEAIINHRNHHHHHHHRHLQNKTTKASNFYVFESSHTSGLRKMARTSGEDITRHSVEIFEYMGPEDVPTSDTIVLSLRIEHLRDQDYGSYWCIAENDHGTAREEMHLLEYIPLGKVNFVHPTTDDYSFYDHFLEAEIGRRSNKPIAASSSSPLWKVVPMTMTSSSSSIARFLVHVIAVLFIATRINGDCAAYPSPNDGTFDIRGRRATA